MNREGNRVRSLQYQLETRKPRQHFLKDKGKASKPASCFQSRLLNDAVSIETILSRCLLNVEQLVKCEFEGKPLLGLLCPPQIMHDLSWD
jgi:hypothetical protein